MLHPRRALRTLATAALAASACATAGTPGDILDRYRLMPPPSALAVSGELRADAPAGMVGGARSDVDAATTALHRCEQARLRQAAVAPCELVRLNRQPIATGADIRATADPPHPLPLWRVERNGRRLYLAGSIHLLKPSLLPLPQPWHDIFAASDALVVELDPASLAAPEMRALLLRMTTLPEPKTLRQVLPPATYERLAGWLAKQGTPIARFEHSTPLMVATGIQMDTFAAFGYSPGQGLEQQFLDAAATRGLPVHELETAAEQLSALLDHPLAVQVAVLADTLDQYPQANSLLTDMVSAWWRGDAAALVRLFGQQSQASAEARRYIAAIIDGRNHRMIQRVDALLNTPPVEFVLVGAAHMGGETGLIEGLTERGARITQLQLDAVHTAVGAVQSGSRLASMPVGKPSRLEALRSRQ